MQIQKFLDLLFERANAEGMTPCEAYLSTGDSFQVMVNKGELIDYNVSSSLGLGFRALVRGKMGYASTQALDEAAIELLIEGARTNALLVENEDEQFIFPGSPDYPKREIYNPALDRVSADEKIALALELERKTLGRDPRVTQVDECVLMSGAGMVRIVNSLGLDVQHRDNMVCAATGAVAREAEQVSTGFEYQVARDLSGIDLDGIAKRASDEAASGLCASLVESGVYKVVLQNTAAVLLLSVFSQVFSADNAQKGLSLLKGREGERVASDAVTLMDDPETELGLSAAPFDAEGVATYKKAVVDKGVLVTLLHNLKTAKKQGLKASTANASKAGYSAPISVAPSNFYIVPGEKGLDELMGDVGDGLLITSLEGLHSGANTISGDFSLSAKGYVIEGGKKGRAVSQITVSGNFYALLKGVIAASNDLRFSLPGGSSMGSPSLLIEQLSVAGL